MTGNELIRTLNKRRDELKGFLTEILVETGIAKGKEIIIEKEVEKVITKELTTEKETELNESISELDSKLKAEQEKNTKLAEQNAEMLAKLTASQSSLTPEERDQLRASLNDALKKLIEKEPTTAADKFIALQISVANVDTLQDKLELISKEIQ